MKRVYLFFAAMALTAAPATAQFAFDPEVELPEGYVPETVVLPASPLQYQVLFEGQVDMVQTTEIPEITGVDIDGNPITVYGEAQGETPAKQWHDFIGFTPATADERANAIDADGNPVDNFLGWVSVNHEMIYADNRIGDGGGMTAFGIRQDDLSGQLEVVEMTVTTDYAADSRLGETTVTRTGEFFNVDFVNVVGETGMNCAGITSLADGRIWTAEEWFRTSNSSINEGGEGVRNVADFTLPADLATEFPNMTDIPATIQAYENFNWMVEIDPRQAVAIRKQYNWGRQPFEGGAILADNRTVYLGVDNTPGYFVRFVADTEGDFNSGSLQAYKHDGGDEGLGNWVEIANSADGYTFQEMLDFMSIATVEGCSMFNRIEWTVWHDGKLYMTETARDGTGSRFLDGIAAGAQMSPHIIPTVRARHPEFDGKPDSEVLDFVARGQFRDYYGRVLVYDPATDMVETFLDGGPFFAESPMESAYPNKHLSNPDGLNVMTVAGQSFLVICEDLNGTSNGRVPAGVSNRTCELFLLDLSIANPTVDDLIRISAVPAGAEVTGARPVPSLDASGAFTGNDNFLLVNSQHPSSSNPEPYNNSLTFAITGWEAAVTSLEDELIAEDNGFSVFPNPVTRELRLNRVTDVAIYDNGGRRLKVFRGVESIDVSDLSAGVYILKTKEGDVAKIVVEK